MNLYEIIIAAYPELVGSTFFEDGTISLQNDSDGLGDHIKHWGYSLPIPDGLTVGKPTA